MVGLKRYLPILEWAPCYTRQAFADDIGAAIVVTIMLIPQSLAYALLAGLPVEAGLYASIMSLLVYAVFGTSRALSVGPVAVVSLMTAAAIGEVAQTGTATYLEAALMLALLSGGFLVLLGILRMGFLANFLSHPVISGFIAASAVIIAINQLRHIIGVEANGHVLFDVVNGLIDQFNDTNPATLVVGIGAIVFLVFTRMYANQTLMRFGLSNVTAGVLTKAAPILVVIIAILAVQLLDLETLGVAVVGDVPSGLQELRFPKFDFSLVQKLLVPTILISLVGFVESISVAQTLAAKKRQSVDPDQELIGLGFANLAAGVGGGYPVTGGFARSVVNFDAGANTQAAGAFAGVGMVLAVLFLTPVLYSLPKAVLAATIIVAVLSLIDFAALKRTWLFSKADGAAMTATILATLGFGVEIGIVTGVAVSIALHLYRTSRPHTAIVGRIPGSEHFRNIKRHDVETCSGVLTLRIDESLYFANARFLEEQVSQLVEDNPGVQHFILMCPAVNTIDASALESLELINSRLKEAEITFHLSEVKGPVMDRFRRSHFLQALTGKVFLSQHQAEEETRSCVARAGEKREPLSASEKI